MPARNENKGMMMDQNKMQEKVLPALPLLGSKVVNSNGTIGIVQCIHFDVLNEVSVTVFLGMRTDMPQALTTTTSLSQWKQV